MVAHRRKGNGVEGRFVVVVVAVPDKCVVVSWSRYL